MNSFSTTVNPSRLNERVSALDKFLELNWMTSENVALVEEYLIEARPNPEHILSLIEYIKICRTSPQRLLFVTIELQNAIISQYQMYFEARRDVNDQFLDALKTSVLQLYFDLDFLRNHPKIFNIISKTVKFLITKEFPICWESIFEILVASFSQHEHEVNYLAFKLLKHITKLYPYKLLTDELAVEIKAVITKFHDIIMEYCQGYVSMLEGNSISYGFLLSLISMILKIFSNLLAQEVNQTIEEHLHNWMKILRPIFDPELNQIITKVQNSRSGQLKNYEKEITEGWFECKGEAIKIISLMSSRYDEDLTSQIDEFAQYIWANCLEYASSPKVEKSKLLMNSMKYFKSLATSSKYFDFFEQNVSEILTKLIIPSLSHSSQDLETFQKEPESFVETIFLLQNVDDKKKNIIHDFISTLTRFHRNTVLGVVEIMLKEVLNSRSLDNTANELLFLTIFYDAVIIQANDYGATSIICPLEFLLHVYQNLIEGIVDQFADNSQNLDRPTLQNAIYLVSHYLRFIFMFQNFIGYQRCSMLIFKLFCKTINVQNETYQTLLIEMVVKVLRTKNFILEDNMSKPVEHLSFYQRYYNNPQKIVIRWVDQLLVFNPNQNIDCLQEVFKAFSWYYQNNVKNINARTMKFLKFIVDMLNESSWSVFAPEVFNLIEHTLELLKTKKLSLNFNVIDAFFEILAQISPRSSSSDISRVRNIMAFILTLLSEQFLELNALIIQTIGVYIEQTRIDVMTESDQIFIKLFKNALNVESYNKSTIGICFANFFFIQQCILANPVLLDSSSKMIENILQRTNDLLQLRVSYDFLKFLAIKKLPIKHFLRFAILGIDGYYQCIHSSNEESKKFIFMKQIFIKEFLEFLLIYSAQTSFEIVAIEFRKINMEQQLKMILTSEDCLSFLSNTVSRPFRAFMVIRMAKILFDEYPFFLNSNCRDEFTGLLHAVLENIWKLKFASRTLKHNFDSRRQEIEKFDEITDSNYSNIYRLKACTDIGGEFISFFRTQSNIKQAPDTFFIESFKNFLIHNKLSAAQVVTDNKYMSLF